jgi:hypothetical protein
MSRAIAIAGTILAGLVGAASGGPGRAAIIGTPWPTFAGEQATSVPPTAMETALDELRRRFPNQVVIGFEGLFGRRSESETRIDLGPKDAPFDEVLSRIRLVDPNYRVELIESRLGRVNTNS